MIAFRLFVIVAFFVRASGTVSYDKVREYFKDRVELLEDELGNSLRAKLLTEEELEANDILMAWKNKEFDEGFKEPNKFLAAKHFFEAKPLIEKSKVFQIIEKLPKGASLHSHYSAMGPMEYIISNITYRDNLYCNEVDSRTIKLKFFESHPGPPWITIERCRKLIFDFDTKLKQQFTLNSETFANKDVHVNKIWKQFEGIFTLLTPLLSYKPVFEDYFYQALKTLYEDNVKYVEFRTVLLEIYDLDGKTYEPEEVVEIYITILEKFMTDHPDFWGAKLIYAPHRFMNEIEMDEQVYLMERLTKKFPDFIAGFDLVGQEDVGPTLKSFIPSLLEMKKITNLFLHGGETLWNGMKPDENLLDAVLLNATRIGHVYSILKHPELLEIVKERQVGLEICPISNQVLGLVHDFRNHPANFLIASNYPVVIASDDPALWDVKGLSYDWYVAFMGMASKRADLGLLKQLALNSIHYSSMDEDHKYSAKEKWKEDWNKFLKLIIDDSSLDVYHTQ